MLMRYKIFVILLLSFVCATGYSEEKESSDMGKVKRERQAALKKADETAGKLKQNKNKTSRTLRELNAISADIDEHERSIGRLQKETVAYDKRIRRLNDSITTGEKHLESLRQNYAQAVRKMRTRTTAFDQLMFLFSSSSFHEAYRRMRYLRQFAKWRDKQVEEIHLEMQNLERRKTDMLMLKEARLKSVNELDKKKRSLEKKQVRQKEVVADLKKEGGALQKLLDEQNRKAEALDRELDRLIALEAKRAEERRRREEEQRKEQERKLQAEAKKRKEQQKDKDVAETPEPIKKTVPAESAVEKEELALTGSFESNKGKLPYPISGNCRIIRKFGRQQHPELKHVMTNNGGIDIEASKGAIARSVFGGKVSAIFRQDGYDMVVMVRHGKYLTIYVNLSEIYVSVGQTVKINQSIGKISTDAETGDRSILHFEVRRERDKLNPVDWLKPKN